MRVCQKTKFSTLHVGVPPTIFVQMLSLNKGVDIQKTAFSGVKSEFQRMAEFQAKLWHVGSLDTYILIICHFVCVLVFFL